MSVVSRKMTTPRGGASGNGTPASKSGGGGQHTHGGRKGQNIDHLLGFTMPPRARPPPPVAAKKRRSGSAAPFNKERYVNAQYRFLLKPTGDYTAFYADADVFLHWPDILSVLIPTSSALSNSSAPSSATNGHAPHLETHEGASCPICLSPPTAPRMTKCGHVFCFPCILHYLSTPDGEGQASASTSYSQPHPRPGTTSHRPPGSAPASRAASYNTQSAMQSAKPPPKWKRCPICWDAVYAREVKAVEFWDTRAEAIAADEATSSVAGPSEGLLMRLMERPHLTTLALPISATWPGNSEPLIAQRAAPWHFLPDVKSFSKLMLSTPEHVEEHLKRDAAELAGEHRLLESLGGSSEPSLQFVDLALAKVHEQMERARHELDLPHIRNSIEKAYADLAEVQEIEGARLEGEASKRQSRRRSLVKTSPLSTVDQETHDATSNLQAQIAEGAPEAHEGAAEWLALHSHQSGVGSGVAHPLKADSTESATPASSVKAGLPRPRRNINPPAPSSSSYLFYQAATGQHIYLQPLDVKVLLAEYGSYTSFPRQLRLKIQGADEGSMNEELRRRCRYLTHLPMGTDVVFCEVDWDYMASQSAARGEGEPGARQLSGRVQFGQMPHNTPLAHQPVVSRSTLKPFEQGMKIRRNRRRDRERKDDRARTRAEEAEAASRPGGANFAARRQAAVDSFANDPDFAAAAAAGFVGGSSYGSSPGVSGLASSSSAADDTDQSPTFRESALWGAERDFPVHPGEAEEDFPAAASSAHANVTNAGRAEPSAAEAAGTKTVWGTRAAQSPFAAALHASSRLPQEGHDYDDSGIDWDWLDLEEDYIVGSRNAPQMRGSRGLNKQQKGANATPATPRNGSSGARTPAAETPGRAFGQEHKIGEHPPTAYHHDETSRSIPTGETEATPTNQTQSTRKAKPKKKKLVLTSGGRGAA